MAADRNVYLFESREPYGEPPQTIQNEDLTGPAPFVIHPIFFALTRDLNAVAMLSYAVVRCLESEDGSFQMSWREWQEQTGLSRDRQDAVRKHLRAFPFWQEKRQGSPPVISYRVDVGALETALSESKPFRAYSPGEDVKQANSETECISLREIFNCGILLQSIAGHLHNWRVNAPHSIVAKTHKLVRAHADAPVSELTKDIYNLQENIKPSATRDIYFNGIFDTVREVECLPAEEGIKTNNSVEEGAIIKPEKSTPQPPAVPRPPNASKGGGKGKKAATVPDSLFDDLPPAAKGKPKPAAVGGEPIDPNKEPETAREVVALYFRLYQERYGQYPVSMNSAAFSGNVKSLVNRRGVKEVCAILRSFFDTANPNADFYEKTGHGAGMFINRYDALLVTWQKQNAPQRNANGDLLLTPEQAAAESEKHEQWQQRQRNLKKYGCEEPTPAMIDRGRYEFYRGLVESGDITEETMKASLAKFGILEPYTFLEGDETQESGSDSSQEEPNHETRRDERPRRTAYIWTGNEPGYTETL